MKTECKARKWGNSLGITIPREIVEKEHIKADEALIITIKKKRPSLFGIVKDRSTPAQVREWLEEDRRIERESEKRFYESLGARS